MLLKFQTVHTGASKISKNVLAVYQYFNHFYSLKYPGYLTISYLLCLVFSSSQKRLLLSLAHTFQREGGNMWWSTCCIPCNFSRLFQVNFGFLFFIGRFLNHYKLSTQTEAREGSGFRVPIWSSNCF